MTTFVRRASVAVRRRRALVASWQSLSWAERREFLLFVLLIPAVTVALRTLGFRRAYALLSATSRRAGAPEHAGMARTHAVQALRRARRYAPYRGNCLPQSLALWWRLRLQRVEADFRLGARLDSGDFSAHAWVEACGIPLNDSPAVHTRFAAFVPLQSGSLPPPL